MFKERDLFEPRDPLFDSSSELFSGRIDILDLGIRQISGNHSILLYYGDLGIGKSSVARQLYSIVKGDEYANRRHPELTNFARSQLPQNCIPLWISCRGYKNFDDLLKNLCFSIAADGNDSFAKRFPNFVEQSNKWIFDAALELRFGPLKGSIKGKQQPQNSKDLESAKEQYLSRIDGIDLFFHLIGKIDENKEPFNYIIFFDDFEKLEDKSRFSDLFFRSSRFRYVIVGIAEIPNELIEQNESLERHLVGAQVRVDPLTSRDVQWIYDNAARRVKKEKIYKKLSFSQDFVDQVFSISAGLPMIAQFYGWRSLVDTNAIQRLTQEDVLIDTGTISVIEDNFFDSRKSVQPNLVEKIGEAIGNSVARPKILRILATKFETWFTLKQARDIAELSTQKNMEDHIEKFVEFKILIKSARTGKFKFSTPTCRMFCRRVLIK